MKCYYTTITILALDVYIDRPGPGLRLAQPGGPTAGVSVFPFYLKTKEDPASETL
jgi:hypothetical protein